MILDVLDFTSLTLFCSYLMAEVGLRVLTYQDFYFSTCIRVKKSSYENNKHEFSSYQAKCALVYLWSIRPLTKCVELFMYNILLIKCYFLELVCGFSGRPFLWNFMFSFNDCEKSNLEMSFNSMTKWFSMHFICNVVVNGSPMTI